MNREEALSYLATTCVPFGKAGTINDWTFHGGQYIHTLHDPITIDDWNRAKIVPNTKVRILSPEHSEHVQKLAFEAGFTWQDTGKTIFGLSADDVIFFSLNNTMVFNAKNISKEIFIELPPLKEAKELLDQANQMLKDSGADINARVLAEKVGSKHDQGKPLYNLIPVHAEAELVDVLTFGATKYAPNQWRNVPDATERYTAAAMRHMAAYRMGDTHDEESGKHHLAHAMCCLAFIIELDLEKNK